MAIVYPGTPPGSAVDVFTVPTEPEGVPLSSAGSADRNHTQLHDDEGAAIEALEAWTSLRTHDHSGDDEDVAKGSKLAQANTHEDVDTDAAPASIHHTIGPGGNQAAPGNHAHDYNGPFIYNTPLRICTTTTRPTDPPLGLMIWENDTNTMRVWSAFPGNTLIPGTVYTDAFSRVSTTDMGSEYSQAYVIGNSPADGTMATPVSGMLRWIPGANNKCRCVARSIAPGGAATTDTDDQSITFKTGTVSIQTDIFSESPSNDVYLRMSSDSKSYVRVSIDSNSADIYYATNGLATEKRLGGAPAGTTSDDIDWEAKALGRTFILYRGGVQILSLVDHQNVTLKGAANRGWGLGMTAAKNDGFGDDEQLHPGEINSITVRDMPIYTSQPIWQLLPVGATPYVRAEAHIEQQIAVGNRVAAFFTAILEDWFDCFGKGKIGTMTSVPPATDIVIAETGHYDVHASIPWHPGHSGMDRGMIGFEVNGLDIGRKNWEFMRGNTYSPGFAQTNEIFIHWHFAAGDVLRVVCEHNSQSAGRLFASTATGNKQVAFVDLKFTGP